MDHLSSALLHCTSQAPCLVSHFPWLSVLAPTLTGHQNQWFTLTNGVQRMYSIQYPVQSLVAHRLGRLHQAPNRLSADVIHTRNRNIEVSDNT